MNCERKNYEEARRENRIGEKDLVREILPLLKENFLAVCRLNEDGIAMHFLNGQTATVAIWFDDRAHT